MWCSLYITQLSLKYQTAFVEKWGQCYYSSSSSSCTCVDWRGVSAYRLGTRLSMRVSRFFLIGEAGSASLVLLMERARDAISVAPTDRMSSWPTVDSWGIWKSIEQYSINFIEKKRQGCQPQWNSFRFSDILFYFKNTYTSMVENMISFIMKWFVDKHGKDSDANFTNIWTGFCHNDEKNSHFFFHWKIGNYRVIFRDLKAYFKVQNREPYIK